MSTNRNKSNETFSTRTESAKAIHTVWLLSLYPDKSNTQIASLTKSTPDSVAWYRTKFKQGLVKPIKVGGKKAIKVSSKL